MTSSAEAHPDADRAAIVAGAWASIRAGSKSFASASRLFDPQTRERSWLLYAWCRACDDYADGQVLGHAPQEAPLPLAGEGLGRGGASEASDKMSSAASSRFGHSPLSNLSPAGGERPLDHIKSQTVLALSGSETGELPFDALRIVAAECRIPRIFIHDHIEGFAMDARDWRPRTEADLLQYCYHVAGAVGCMMAVLMGVDPDDTDTLDRACDLGIAFQLANIARDLMDDDAIGRCYLPLEWLAGYDIPPGQHMAPLYRPRMAVAAQRLCTLAGRYEASARTGAKRLPFRARWAVLSAANIYGGIAREVARRGIHAWDRRVVIGKVEKLRHVAAAFNEACFSPKAEASRDGLWTRSHHFCAAAKRA